MTLQQNAVVSNERNKAFQVWNVSVQQIVPKDLAELVEMENAYATPPLTDFELAQLFCTGRYYGIAARLDGPNIMIGYLLFEVLEGKRYVRRLVLDKAHRHLHIFVDLLNCACNEQKMPTVIEVPEGNLRLQLALRAAGFRATKILKYRTSVSGLAIEDAYEFQIQ